jgi:hypothetical protein
MTIHGTAQYRDKHPDRGRGDLGVARMRQQQTIPADAGTVRRLANSTVPGWPGDRAAPPAGGRELRSALS